MIISIKNDIISDTSIYKVGERVFQIGELNYNCLFIKCIISLLDRGSKFVPCLHFNHFHIFKNLLINFENYLPDFNKFLFFKRNAYEKNQNINILEPIHTSNLEIIRSV
jgi:hypothetical protein